MYKVKGFQFKDQKIFNTLSASSASNNPDRIDNTVNVGSDYLAEHMAWKEENKVSYRWDN